MGLKFVRGIRLFFQKILKKTIAHPLFVFFCDAPLLLTFKRMLVTLWLVCPMSNGTKNAQIDK
jgi:hypothetical protein